MKDLIQKFKNIFTSKEAQEFAKEVKDKTDELQSKAHELADKTKEKASAAKEKAESVSHAVASELRTDGKISYDDFKKVEVKLGTILSVEKIEKSDKLLLLKVDLGEDEPRQIVSGIALYFKDVQSLAGRQAMFVANLEPRKIFGIESNGMIFAVSEGDTFSILEPDSKMTPGIQAS